MIDIATITQLVTDATTSGKATEKQPRQWDPDRARILGTVVAFGGILGVAAASFMAIEGPRIQGRHISEIAASLPDDTLLDSKVEKWWVYGLDQTNLLKDFIRPKEKASILDPDALPAQRVTVTHRRQNVYDAGAHRLFARPLMAGDRMKLKIWLRLAPDVDNPPRSDVHVRMQYRNPPYDMIGERDAIITRDWQAFDLDGVAPFNFGVGDASLIVHVGHGPHTVDIGHAIVTATRTVPDSKPGVPETGVLSLPPKQP